MVFVRSDLAITEEVLRFSFAIIREVKDVKHIVFFLLDHLPAEIHDALESEHLMVFLPAVAD